MKNILFIFISFSLSFLHAQNSDRFDINNIKVNSKNNEFGVIIANDGAVYYLRSSNKNKKLNEKSAKLYRSDIESSGEFSKGKSFPVGAIHAVFSNDGSRVYFSKEENGYFQLYKADVSNNGRWKNQKKLHFNTPNTHFKQPALNQDNTVLFFVSNKSDSYGNFDIYYVNIDGENCGNPIHLGKNVNTSGTEIYPYIGDDNKLFFSSTKHHGLGGLDIFESFYENGHYSKPNNLGIPINGPKDDFAYVSMGNKGYFSSTRIDGFGGADIYFFKDKEPVLSSSNLSINGVIRNKVNKKPIFDVTVELWSPEEHLFTSFTDKKGEFSFDKVKPKVRYDVVSYKEGYYGFAEVQTIPENKQKLFLYLDPESPEEYEEEFNVSSEMTVIDTQTNEVIVTEAEKIGPEKKELSFAERRDLARIEKEEKKKKEIAAAKEAERLETKRKEEARLAALAARKEMVEKEIAARKAHAIKVAEELRKRKAAEELAEKERIEAEIVAQEKAKKEQKRRAEEAKERARLKRIEAARLAQIKKEKEIQAEKERIAQEKAEKLRIAEEKQAEIAARKQAIEKERQDRIAQAKATAEKLKKETAAKELAEKQQIEEEIIAQEEARADQKRRSEEAKENAIKERLEAERIASIEQEEQIQAEKERIAQEQAEKLNLAAEKQAEIAARKQAIEKERQERIAQAQETADRLKKERANKELEETIAQAENTAEQKLPNGEKIEDVENQKAEETIIENEKNRIAQEQTEKIRLAQEKQAEIASRKDAIEKERQKRIAEAKATAERLRREANKKAEEEIVENNDDEIETIAQDDAKDNELQETKQKAIERKEQYEAQKMAIEEERQRRIAQAQETADRLRKEKEQKIIAQNEIIEKEQEALENEEQTIAHNDFPKPTNEIKHKIDPERQRRIAEAQATAKRLREEQQLAQKQAQQNEKELIRAEAEVRYTKRIIEQKAKAQQKARTVYSKNIYKREQQLAEQKVAKLKKKIEVLTKEKANKTVQDQQFKQKILETETYVQNLEAGKDVPEIEQSITQIDDTLVEEEVIANENNSVSDNYNSSTEIQNDNSGRCSRNINGAILSSLDNKPIAGANIDIYYDGQNIESIQTNSKGEFHFLNVDCNTDYTLISFKKEYNNIAKAEVNTEHLPDQIVLLLEPDPEEVVEKEIIVENHTVKTIPKKVPKVNPKKEIIKEEVKEVVADNNTPVETRQKHQQEENVSTTVAASDKITISEINSDAKAPDIVGKKIQLNPIYFDLDEWYLTLPARRELDKIIVLMHLNPTMIIESGSHTDTRGPFEYNLELSEKRSQETVGYLIANGVDPDRISGRGYGESMPLNHCVDGVKCSEKEHLVNRRTEFIILRR